MKNILLLLALLTLNSAFSQTTKAVFSYDNAGNRIKRQIIIQEIEPIEGPQPLLNSQQYNASSFNVYPNTTQGIITITSNDKEFLAIENKIVAVYDYSGKLLIEQNYDNENQTVDLSNLSKGVYLVKISASGELKGEWNVVRE